MLPIETIPGCIPIISLPDDEQRRQNIVFHRCAGCSSLWLYTKDENGDAQFECFDPTVKKNHLYSAYKISGKVDGDTSSHNVSVYNGVGFLMVVCIPGSTPFQGFGSFEEIADYYNSTYENGIDFRFNTEIISKIVEKVDGLSHRRLSKS